MEIHEAITRLRAALDWTKERLADELGVTGMSIDHWEKQRHQPTDVHRVKLADVARTEGLANLPRRDKDGRRRWLDLIEALEPESFRKEAARP